MKAILEYHDLKWGVKEATQAEIDGHPGRYIQMYIQNGGFLIRGFFNPNPAKLEGYEGNKDFEKVKAHMEEKGRIPGCVPPNMADSNLTEALLKLTGLTLNFIYKMKESNIHISLQHCMGSEWSEFFKTHYLKYSEDPDHYELKNEKLPVFVQIPPSNGRTIFKFSKVHRDIILKKKSRYEIKPAK